jgi:glucan phosphoethanolaminetransferase (alkaline phosphatase superfamily)
MLTGLPLIQAGTARATLQSDAGTDTVSTSLVYLPWWIITIAVLVLLLVALTIWRGTVFVRRAKRAIAQVALTDRGESNPPAE